MLPARSWARTRKQYSCPGVRPDFVRAVAVVALAAVDQAAKPPVIAAHVVWMSYPARPDTASDPPQWNVTDVPSVTADGAVAVAVGAAVSTACTAARPQNGSLAPAASRTLLAGHPFAAKVAA